MILVDFGIICIGQKHRSYPENMGQFEFEAYRRTEKSKPMYDKEYNFHTADRLTGYWYFVWFEQRVIYEKSFFDITVDSGNTCWVYVEKEWHDAVRKILEFYFDESPEHRIAVLIREQDESNNISHPSIALDEFMGKLSEGSVRWNELYFIER